MDLTPLSNGLPGLRTLLPIETKSSRTDQISNQNPVPANPCDDSGVPCLDFICSDESLDRFHEIISPTGWRLDSYRRNPVFQNAHQYGDVIFTLGRALITEVCAVAGRQALCQRVQFATDVNPIARIAYGLYRGKFLNAVSVGFIPLRWQDAPQETAGSTKQPRRKYLEQELLEVSAVAIPANPDALALAVKSGAVEKSDLRESLALVLEFECTAPAGWIAPCPNYSDKLFQLARELRRILRSA